MRAADRHDGHLAAHRERAQPAASGHGGAVEVTQAEADLDLEVVQVTLL